MELGNFIAGPFAGQLLGDYGAQVIKVESPDGGDSMPHSRVHFEADATLITHIARNKQALARDPGPHPG